MNHYRGMAFLFIAAWMLFSGSLNQTVRAAEDITTAEAEENLGRQLEQAGLHRQALSHYVSALKGKSTGSDGEQRLREKIFQVAARLDPPPAVPAEVERYMSRGTMAVRMSKTKEDFKNAVAEFEKALALAPWLPELYFNIGVVQEKADLPEDAIRSFKFYVLAAPSEKDAKDIQKKIYELEYANEANRRNMLSWVGTWVMSGFMEAWSEYGGIREKLTPSQTGKWFIEVTGVLENGGAKLLLYKDQQARNAEEVWNGVATSASLDAKLVPGEKNWMSNSIVRSGPGALKMIRENGTVKAWLSKEVVQMKRSTRTAEFLWTYRYEGLIDRVR